MSGLNGVDTPSGRVRVLKQMNFRKNSKRPLKLMRLLVSVRHHVNLQCIGESVGSVIVLFAVVWLFSYMLPHHVLS